MLCMAKTAALVESNAHEYGRYLREVFAGDQAMAAGVHGWAEEEAQHGAALRRWCEIADPGYDFAAAFAAFTARVRMPAGSQGSVRGSKSGELLARCVVECGTSLSYSALHERVREPVLAELCGRIAADEFRHYRMFHRWGQQWRAREPLGVLGRARVLVDRMLESEDDEIAYAWHCSATPHLPYHRRRAFTTYLQLSVGLMTPRLVDRSITMVMRAAGVSERSRWARCATTAAQRLVRWRLHRTAHRTGGGASSLGCAPSPSRPGAMPGVPDRRMSHATAGI
jgi:hypothetical protein